MSSRTTCRRQPQVSGVFKKNGSFLAIFVENPGNLWLGCAQAVRENTRPFPWAMQPGTRLRRKSSAFGAISARSAGSWTARSAVAVRAERGLRFAKRSAHGKGLGLPPYGLGAAQP
ncbi:hypothetical protein WBO52_29145, partial [Saccharothrix sp. CCNWLW140]|uniref:hypothetical protein n=1 Tax=Saccharothrix sp. CCNWLW140 TaxID=3128895 RepID=UPI00307F9D83